MSLNGGIGNLRKMRYNNRCDGFSDTERLLRMAGRIHRREGSCIESGEIVCGVDGIESHRWDLKEAACHAGKGSKLIKSSIMKANGFELGPELNMEPTELCSEGGMWLSFVRRQEVALYLFWNVES